MSSCCTRKRTNVPRPLAVTYTLLGFACLLTLEMGKCTRIFIMLIEEIITENYSNWDPKNR